jgi:hypothetical protein
VTAAATLMVQAKTKIPRFARDDNYVLSGGIRPIYLTSKFTVEPARTFCPAGGVWVTIILAGDG